MYAAQQHEKAKISNFDGVNQIPGQIKTDTVAVTKLQENLLMWHHIRTT
jgi:hypothetical protein